jgi:hypothetical protein
MRLLLDNYFLAYTDGQKELEFPLTAPTALSEVLALAGIPAWESHRFTVNGQPADDDALLVTDGDVVQLQMV